MVSSSARPHGRSIAGIKGRTEWLEFSYEASAGETADLTGTSRADRPSGRHNSDCDQCPRFRKVGCATRELRRHKRTVLVGMKPERANAREIEGKQALLTFRQEKWREWSQKECCSTSVIRIELLPCWQYPKRQCRMELERVSGYV